MIDVKEFGALGDGRSKDTEVIQQALNTGRMLYFPPRNIFVGHLVFAKRRGN